MPGKAYGVADPLPRLGGRDAGGNVVITAGVDTTVITFSTIAAISPGFYYPAIWGVLCLTLGATAPSNIAVAAHINGGSAFSTFNIFTTLLVNSGNLAYPMLIVGSTSNTLYFPGPAIFTISLLPTGQNITYVDGPTAIRVFLFPGPDA